MGVNEATVAARLKRLEGSSIMRVVALTDFEAFGYTHLCFAKLRVRGRPALEVGAELADIPQTISVTLAAGRYDLIVALLARDRKELSGLIGRAIPAVAGVDEVNSELALEVLRFDSMWALLGAPQQHLPPSPLEDVVDELDLSIIGLLQQDARSSNRWIAGELDVSEGTVRTRIRRMEERRLIRIQAISDVMAFGLTAHAYVGIRVEGGRVDDVADALLGRDSIAALVRSLGEFDFLAVVTASDRTALEDLILNRIGSIAGVRRTETFESWRTLKHSYNWARLVDYARRPVTRRATNPVRWSSARTWADSSSGATT